MNFTGYYKYTSVNNDSFDIYAILTKWNPGNDKRDIVGAAMFQDSNSVISYTKFDLSFQYFTQDTPDTISVVFASSAAGDLFLGNVGTTLYIDEIALELPVGIKLLLMPEVNVNVYPNPAISIIKFEIDRKISCGKLVLINSEGKSIMVKTIKDNNISVDVKNFAKGLYYYKLLKYNNLVNSGSFIVK